MGRNKITQCFKCKKSMRSDHLSRHFISCKRSDGNRNKVPVVYGKDKRIIKECKICNKMISTANFARHVRKHNKNGDNVLLSTHVIETCNQDKINQIEAYSVNNNIRKRTNRCSL